jgi:GT2 family glycosyltransferase
MMARREAFEAAGRLEESFYYFHEQIFCARLQRAGYDNYLHPASRIIHFEGVGSGVRTKRVRRAHIHKFHVAAYRWFCLHHGIAPLNPLRLPVAGALAARAAFLMAAETLKPDPRRVVLDVTAGRPEGGIPA